MDFIQEIWAFMIQRKKLWLIPLFLMMLVLGSLIVLSHGSVIAPFIYTFF